MKKQFHVHILAICGYTTSGLALMARDSGFRVSGSDEDAYPPMNALLTKEKIPWADHHALENLSRWGVPDLVVQGNQIRPGNLELLEAQRRGLRIISDSEFFYQLTKRRRRIAVCGTHGKTTTAALIAWIFEVAGRKPGFRLGTITKNFDAAVRAGRGREFIFEGDEYTTTFSDSRPKFYHFHPQVAVINNIEWDHPDAFKTPRIYVELFRRYLVKRMAADGLLVVNAEDGNVQKVIKDAPCRVITFGLGQGQFQVRRAKYAQAKSFFSVVHQNRRLGNFESGLSGEHNLKNCLAAIVLSLSEGISLKNIQRALRTFKGTSRRFEVIGVKRGITVIDDYAHHPTKARATIAAAKKRFPQGRIFAVYVPHTYSRTSALIQDYARAFTQADFVLVANIEAARERHLKVLIHAKDLVEKITKNQDNVFYRPRPTDIIDFVKQKAKAGDVVLCMSVRGFDDLAQKILKNL